MSRISVIRFIEWNFLLFVVIFSKNQGLLANLYSDKGMWLRSYWKRVWSFIPYHRLETPIVN